MKRFTYFLIFSLFLSQPGSSCDTLSELVSNNAAIVAWVRNLTDDFAIESNGQYGVTYTGYDRSLNIYHLHEKGRAQKTEIRKIGDYGLDYTFNRHAHYAPIHLTSNLRFTVLFAKEKISDGAQLLIIDNQTGTIIFHDAAFRSFSKAQYITRKPYVHNNILIVDYTSRVLAIDLDKNGRVEEIARFQFPSPEIRSLNSVYGQQTKTLFNPSVLSFKGKGLELIPEDNGNRILIISIVKGRSNYLATTYKPNEKGIFKPQKEETITPSRLVKLRSEDKLHSFLFGETSRLRITNSKDLILTKSLSEWYTLDFGLLSDGKIWLKQQADKYGIRYYRFVVLEKP